MQTISVLVRNRKTHIFGYFPQKAFQDYFSFYVPNYRFMPLFKQGRWDGRVKLIKNGMVATGLFLALYRELEEKLNLKFKIEYEITKPEFLPNVDSDRPYQIECVRKMQEACNQGGGLILAATGVGKTRMTGLLFKSLVGSACFVVDELTLMKQALEELTKIVGEPIGHIGHSEFNPKRITVVTIQTLHKHKDKPHFKEWAKSLKLMVVDEIHLSINRRQTSTLTALQPPAVLGLTATLALKERHVQLQAFAIAGPVAFRYSLKTGEEEGYLTKGIVVQVKVEHLFSKTRDEWTDQYYQDVVYNRKRNDAVEQLARLAWQEGRSVVVLAEWLPHLKDLSQRLHDIPHYVISGQIDVDDRVKAKQKFNKGQVRLIITNKVFKKGIDIPKLDCIIDAAGMKSKTDCIQKYGRGVRLCPGKEGLLYFDIGDKGSYFLEATCKVRSEEFRRNHIPVFTTTYSTKRAPSIVDKAIAKTKRLVQGG